MQSYGEKNACIVSATTARTGRQPLLFTTWTNRCGGGLGLVVMKRAARKRRDICATEGCKEGEDPGNGAAVEFNSGLKTFAKHTAPACSNSRSAKASNGIGHRVHNTHRLLGELYLRPFPRNPIHHLWSVAPAGYFAYRCAIPERKDNILLHHFKQLATRPR